MLDLDPELTIERGSYPDAQFSTIAIGAARKS
jgi:hypothetical protein